METIVLSPKAFDELKRIMDDPSPPTPALIAAAEKYRDEVAAGRLRSDAGVTSIGGDAAGFYPAELGSIPR